MNTYQVFISGDAGGPFDIYYDSVSVGTQLDTGVSRSSLLAGYNVSGIPDSASSIIVFNTDPGCNNYVTYYIKPPTPAPTVTPTPTPTPTIVVDCSMSGGSIIQATPTPTPSPTATSVVTATPTATPSATPTRTPTPTPTTTTNTVTVYLKGRYATASPPDLDLFYRIDGGPEWSLYTGSPFALTTTATVVTPGLAVPAGLSVEFAAVAAHSDNDAVFHGGSADGYVYGGRCGTNLPYIITPTTATSCYINVDVTVGGVIEIC
jgi:hypothetical protein